MPRFTHDGEVAPSVLYPTAISEQLADLSADESSWLLRQITRDAIMGELSDHEKWTYLQQLINAAPAESAIAVEKALAERDALLAG